MSAVSLASGVELSSINITLWSADPRCLTQSAVSRCLALLMIHCLASRVNRLCTRVCLRGIPVPSGWHAEYLGTKKRTIEQYDQLIIKHNSVTGRIQ